MDKPKNINYIIADDYYGGRIAAEYLVKLGHRKIYFLRTADVFGANERVRAFKDVLLEHGIVFNENLISMVLNNAEESYEETKRVLNRNYGFSAFIAANDFLAMGAMEAIFESGFSIPEDVSLIGYDNLKITSILKVPLTTVDQPKFLFGKLSAEWLIQMIKDPEAQKTSKKIVLKPKLVVRSSCRKL